MLGNLPPVYIILFVIQLYIIFMVKSADIIPFLLKGIGMGRS